MISRYRVILNGVALDSLCENLLITDYQHITGTARRSWSHLANRNMMFQSTDEWSGCGVTVTFQLRVYRIEERQRICQEIIRWAKDGGILQVNDRPGQHLKCVCDRLPQITSALRWLDRLTVTFMAYDQPFWQEDSPTTVSMTGTSQTADVYIPGNAGQNVVEVTVTPGSNTVNSLTVAVGDTSIALTSLSATSSTPITITYSNGIQSIRKGSTSILDKRSSASSDDLIAECGKINHFALTANASATAVFSVRGLWL